jgi:hypothetical protein
MTRRYFNDGSAGDLAAVVALAHRDGLPMRGGMQAEVPSVMGQVLGSVDWIDVFAPPAPLIEAIVRASLLYLGLVVLLCLTPASEAGAVGTPDLLVLLLLADAAQNAMAGLHHAGTALRSW